jgi:hypothetical protein
MTRDVPKYHDATSSSNYHNSNDVVMTMLFLKLVEHLVKPDVTSVVSGMYGEPSRNGGSQAKFLCLLFSVQKGIAL